MRRLTHATLLLFLLMSVFIVAACETDEADDETADNVVTNTPQPTLPPTDAPTPTPAPQAPEGFVLVPAGQPVRIGLATDLSNLLPASGQDTLQSAQLAIDDFNAAGGLQGFEVTLETEEGALTIAEEFIAAGDIVAVIGHLCSGASIPASDLYEEARIPMVSPASTAGFFTARGYDTTNRTIFSDNVQGVVAARYMAEVLGADRIAVLHNGTRYGEGLAGQVALNFQLAGGEVPLQEGIDPEAEDYSDVLDTVAAAEPDILYLGGYESEAARLVEAMRNRDDLADLTFFSADGVNTTDFLEQAAEFSEGVYTTFGQSLGDPAAYEAFTQRYEEVYGVTPMELGAYHSQAYDAANMILAALEEVAEVDEDGNLLIEREALVQAVRNTEDFEGLSGTITCDAAGDCAQARIVVFQAQDGQWVEQDVPDALQVD
ncbi:MAG: branched-chain amino acid ABC transporter substrate-binding protein [Anaerolineales bacterium]